MTIGYYPTGGGAGHWQPASGGAVARVPRTGYIFSPAAIAAIDAYRQMPERHGTVEHQFNADPSG